MYFLFIKMIPPHNFILLHHYRILEWYYIIACIIVQVKMQVNLNYLNDSANSLQKDTI